MMMRKYLNTLRRPFVYLGRAIAAGVRYMAESPQAIQQDVQAAQENDHQRILRQWRTYGSPEVKAAATKILRDQYGE